MKMIKRILGMPVLIIYFGTYFLLYAVFPEAGNVMELLGGISPQGGQGLHILGIMRWDICILPPVAAGILFMDSELGPLRIYTMVREKKADIWILRRFCSIFVSCAAYLSLFALLDVLNGRECRVSGGRFGIFLLIFFLHILLTSTVSAALLVISRDVKAAVLFFMVMEGLLVTAGDIYPQTAPYLPPYWGMIRQEAFSARIIPGYLCATVGLSAFGITLAVFAMARVVKYGCLARQKTA